jgi:hypothetical protein
MVFSPTDAAFEGFRLTRERPRAVLAWAVAYFVFSLAATLFAIAVAGPGLTAFRALYESANPDTVAVSRALSQMMPMLSLIVPIEVVFIAVFNCAIYRAVLRPGEHAWAYFRLGADEMRMVALSVILFVIGMFGVFFVALVVGLAAGTLGAFGNGLAAFLGFAVGAFAVTVAIWAFIRLSLAAPMTFEQRRIVVLGSWRITQGAFWPLCGAYILAFGLALVIFMLTSVITTAAFSAAVLVGGGSLDDVARMVRSDVSSVHAFMSVPALLWQACSSVIITICYIIVLSPSVIAYQGLAGGAVAEPVAG